MIKYKEGDLTLRAEFLAWGLDTAEGLGSFTVAIAKTEEGKIILLSPNMIEWFGSI